MAARRLRLRLRRRRRLLLRVAAVRALAPPTTTTVCRRAAIVSRTCPTASAWHCATSLRAGARYDVGVDVRCSALLCSLSAALLNTRARARTQLSSSIEKQMIAYRDAEEEALRHMDFVHRLTSRVSCSQLVRACVRAFARSFALFRFAASPTACRSSVACSAGRRSRFRMPSSASCTTRSGATCARRSTAHTRGRLRACSQASADDRRKLRRRRRLYDDAVDEPRVSGSGDVGTPRVRGPEIAYAPPAAAGTQATPAPVPAPMI